MDDIAWDQLEHNYGNAGDVPSLLERVRNPDSAVAEDAAIELQNLLYHQGGWVCSAATAAVPFLMDLAADPTVQCRELLLDTVASLANTARKVQRVDSGWLSPWQAAWPSVAALMSDEDPIVRGSAYYLAGIGATSDEAAVAALLRRWPVEPDASARLDIVLAVGDWVGRGEMPAAVTWLQDLVEHSDAQVRLAAVQALGEADPRVPPQHLATLIAAVRDGDLTPWERSAYIDGGPRTVMNWVGTSLNHDPVARTAFALAIDVDSADTELRVATLNEMGALLSEWRSPTAALVPVLAGRLTDTEVEVRWQAAHLLACLGKAATNAADQLAEVLDDRAVRSTRTGVPVAVVAAWALARMGDDRCLPVLLDQVATGWQPLISVHHSPKQLLPAMRARLRIADRPEEIQALIQTLEAWGSRSAPAVPDLIDLLDTTAWQTAASALGAIGPAAVSAAGRLSQLAQEPDGEVAAWAHWCVTGEPDLALTRLNDVSERNIWMLADLGPLAHAHLDRLAELSASQEPWNVVHAAHAHWRVSGSPDLAVQQLIRVITQSGITHPAALPAIRHLGAIGPAAQPALPILSAAVDTDRRLSTHGSWRAFTEDEDRREAVATVLSTVAQH